MDVAALLDVAVGLLSVESTGDRPGELERALELVLDFIGPGFSVERSGSGGKPSALVYLGPSRPRFGVLLSAYPVPEREAWRTTVKVTARLQELSGPGVTVVTALTDFLRAPRPGPAELRQPE